MPYYLQLYLFETDPSSMDDLVEAARLASTFERVGADDPHQLELALTLNGQYGPVGVTFAPTLAFDEGRPAKVVIGRKVPVPTSLTLLPETGAVAVEMGRANRTHTLDVEIGHPECPSVALRLRTEGQALEPRRSGWMPGGSGADVDWAGCVPTGPSWSVLRPAPHWIAVTRIEEVGEHRPLDESAMAPYAELSEPARRRAAERLLGLRGRSKARR